MAQITMVWIEEGCITCDACEETAPDVFHVQDDSCFIRPEVRLDGGFNTNEDSKSGLSGSLGADLFDDIIDAAEGCPVDVIKYATDEDGVSAEATDSAENTTAAADTGSSVGAGSAGDSPDGVVGGEDTSDAGGMEIPSELLEGDRQVMILVGSQSGNCESLADMTAKLAGLGHLNAEIKLMDSATVDDFSAHSRLLIICSTWGEGEMPDNAQTLWDATVASKVDLSGLNFTVCALGDTTYEFYCQSGKDWDSRLEEMGARRVYERVDCDVDYEPAWKSWVANALGSLASIDEVGNFYENMVGSFSEMIIPSKKAATIASAAGVVQPEISVSVKIFRYDPVLSEQGWDTYACTVPGHLSIAQLLTSIQETQDGSLSFRPSGVLSGISVNGRPILADSCRVVDFVCGDSDSLTMSIEPLPGHDVIRDLVVATDSYENRRLSAKSWARTADRVGHRTMQGVVMGTMDTTTSIMLHGVAAMSSPQLAQSWSDSLPYDGRYLGPAVCAQLWRRYLDPRSSEKARNEIIKTLESEGGLWNETDLAAIGRHGAEGHALANTLYECRAELLRLNKFTGKHGRHVKWFSRTVKMFGDVNETILPAMVSGPFGMIANGRQVLRMMTGFTRTGGPMLRDKQALFMPPASIGKMPPLMKLPARNHHEVVAIFNELDKRF